MALPDDVSGNQWSHSFLIPQSRSPPLSSPMCSASTNLPLPALPRGPFGRAPPWRAAVPWTGSSSCDLTTRSLSSPSSSSADPHPFCCSANCGSSSFPKRGTHNHDVGRPILGAAAPRGRSSPWLYQPPKSPTHSNHPIHPSLLLMLCVDVSTEQAQEGKGSRRERKRRKARMRTGEGVGREGLTALASSAFFHSLPAIRLLISALGATGRPYLCLLVLENIQFLYRGMCASRLCVPVNPFSVTFSDHARESSHAHSTDAPRRAIRLGKRVYLSPMVNVMRASACACLETTSMRASMQATLALMWANMAEARHNRTSSFW